MEVGRIGYCVEDKERFEVLGRASGNRYIEVKIYYPVDDDTVKSKTKGSYVSNLKLEHLHPAFKKGIKKHITEVNVYDNVTPSSGKFPVVFFSHGYGGYAEQNTRMVLDLVKTGFIVVSIGHAYEASCIELNNGGYLCYDNSLKITSPMIPAMIAQQRIGSKKLDPLDALNEFKKFQDKYCKFMKTRVKVWADDTLFVLKDLKERAASDKFILNNIFDFDNIGSTGHSFGGCTSYYLCKNSSEFKCGINIDGALFGDYEGLQPKPFMQISCESNVNLETLPIVSRGAETYRLILKNTKHLGLTDGKYIMPSPVNVGKINIEVMENALFSAHREFFSKYLKNEDTNFKFLESVKTDEVVFERFE